MDVIADAYVDVAEYKDRVGKTITGQDGELLAQLTAVSRFLDARLGRFFGQDAAVVTRVYDGNGGTRLWLPDDISTSTGLIVKADLDGDYLFTDETALTLDTDFWLGPLGADKGSEPQPWQYLEVHPTSSRLSVWPFQRRAVQVTARFGWPAVPQVVKEWVVSTTRQLRDMEESGFTLTLQDMDAAIRVSSQSSYLLRDMERMYANLPSF
jgi:hypothetical protein